MKQTKLTVDDQEKNFLLAALDTEIEKYYVAYKLCLRGAMVAPELGHAHFSKERARVRSLIAIHRRLQFGSIKTHADCRRFMIEWRKKTPAESQWKRKFWSYSVTARRRRNPDLCLAA